MKCIKCGRELTSGDGFNKVCFRCNLQSDISVYSIGWQCPVCGRVYAPDVKECFNCNKVPTVSTAGGTIKIKEEE